MIDEQTIENVCIFLVNENKYICEKLNISYISPCDIFNDNHCSDVRKHFCQKLKKEHGNALLCGYIDDKSAVDKLGSKYFGLCSENRISFVHSNIGIFDSFGKHKNFESKFKGLIGNQLYASLETGLNRFDIKYIRICIIAFFLVYNMKLNNPKKADEFDSLYDSFLKIFVPGFSFDENEQMNIFWEELGQDKSGMFDKKCYDSALGKLVCDTINQYVNVLKEEINAVVVRKDIFHYLDELKSDVKDENCCNEESYQENLEKAK